MPGGCGKTFTATQFARGNAGVIYIKATACHNRHTLLEDLAIVAGISAHSEAPELFKRLLAFVEEQHAPLIIVDDAHKLKDRALHTLQQLFGALKGVCGLVLMGNEVLRERIGILTRHHELYRTMGGAFITSYGQWAADIETICKTNGTEDPAQIAQAVRKHYGSLHGLKETIAAPVTARMAA